MNITKLTLGKALRGLRFAAYSFVVMSTIMAILIKGWEVSDEQRRLSTYVLIVLIAMVPHVTSSYTWLVNKFSSDEE